MRNTVLLMFVMLVMAGIVAADERPQGQAPEIRVAVSEARMPAGAGASLVFIDKTTGRVTRTPTAEQRAAMQAKVANLLSRSDEGLVDVTLPGGAVLRDLQGRFMSATIVRIAPDGSQHLECTTGLPEVTGAKAQADSEAVQTAATAK